MRGGFVVLLLACVVLGLICSASVASAAPAWLRVVKPFGAALRMQPATDAAIAYVASCGTELTVVGQREGWYQVYSQTSYLWVGAARVVDGAVESTADCGAAPTFQPHDRAVAMVEAGCLSLRATPSRTAGILQCVPSGHIYEVRNGPVEVAGEDWFEVWSAATGAGWTLADHLDPAGG